MQLQQIDLAQQVKDDFPVRRDTGEFTSDSTTTLM